MTGLPPVHLLISAQADNRVTNSREVTLSENSAASITLQVPEERYWY
jgi:hypothetical protein